MLLQVFESSPGSYETTEMYAAALSHQVGIGGFGGWESEGKVVLLENWKDLILQ
jgi:hypothetical protein